MVSGEDGPGQVIKTSVAGGAFIPVACRLSVIPSFLDHLGGRTMGTSHAVGPAERPHCLEALDVIDEVLNIQCHPWSCARGVRRNRVRSLDDQNRLYCLIGWVDQRSPKPRMSETILRAVC